MKPTILSVTAFTLTALMMYGCGVDKQSEVTLPPGTTITLALNEPLSTDTHLPGHEFAARMTEAVVVNGRTVIPAGTLIRGEVKTAKSATDNCGIPEMTLAFEEVIVGSDDEKRLPAEPVQLVGDLSQSGPAPGDKIDARKTESTSEMAESSDDEAEVVVAMNHDQLELEEGQLFAIELSNPLKINAAGTPKQR